MATRKAKPKAVFLRNLTPANYNWVKKQAKTEGYTMSGFVNKVFADARSSYREQVSK